MISPLSTSETASLAGRCAVVASFGCYLAVTMAGNLSLQRVHARVQSDCGLIQNVSLPCKPSAHGSVFKAKILPSNHPRESQDHPSPVVVRTKKVHTLQLLQGVEDLKTPGVLIISFSGDLISRNPGGLCFMIWFCKSQPILRTQSALSQNAVALFCEQYKTTPHLTLSKRNP